MWNRYRETQVFAKPWLLRFFDQIRFYEVSHDALQQIRSDFPLGNYPLRVEEGSFSLSDYQAFLAQEQTEIEAFTRHRERAFSEELAQWHRTGQFNYVAEEAELEEIEQDWSETDYVVDSPVSGSVWLSELQEGDEVKSGQVLMVLESMKMEIPVQATESGRVIKILGLKGQRVQPGQPLVVIDPTAGDTVSHAGNVPKNNDLETVE